MEFNRVKKQIILALFVALIPTSTVYPAWGWSSFATSFSTVVSQLWNKASSALSEVSPKVAAVGAVLTAGVIAGVYWFKKNKKIERERARSSERAEGDLQVVQRAGNDPVPSAQDEPAPELDVAAESVEADNKFTEEQQIKYEQESVARIKENLQSVRQSWQELCDYAEGECPFKHISDSNNLRWLMNLKKDLDDRKAEFVIEKSGIPTALDLRGSKDFETFKARLEAQYKNNDAKITRATGQSLNYFGYYAYLRISDDEGMKLSSKAIMDQIKPKLHDDTVSEGEKGVLRQLSWVFGNNLTKENYDAFLNGEAALTKLLISTDTATQLLIEFQDIEQEYQMVYEDYLDKLNSRIRSLKQLQEGYELVEDLNGNGKKPEDGE